MATLNHNVMLRLDSELYERLLEYARTNHTAIQAQGRRNGVSVAAAARDAIKKHLDFCDFARGVQRAEPAQSFSQLPSAGRQGD